MPERRQIFSIISSRQAEEKQTFLNHFHSDFLSLFYVRNESLLKTVFYFFLLAFRPRLCVCGRKTMCRNALKDAPVCVPQFQITLSHLWSRTGEMKPCRPVFVTRFPEILSSPCLSKPLFPPLPLSVLTLFLRIKFMEVEAGGG